jgi:hypothetical protein
MLIDLPRARHCSTTCRKSFGGIEATRHCRRRHGTIHPLIATIDWRETTADKKLLALRLAIAKVQHQRTITLTEAEMITRIARKEFTELSRDGGFRLAALIVFSFPLACPARPRWERAW